MSDTEKIRRRYNRIARFYNSMDTMIKEEWRESLLKRATGKVLEIGVGTGANLPYYPAETEVIGIDFSPRMLEFANQRIPEAKAAVQLQQMDVQHLEFPAASFDTVVSTCVFCSVPDPVAGLKEIRRVLKPTGKLLMIEHMLSDNPILAACLHLLNPLTVRISGANVNRKTMLNLELAGLRVQELDSVALGDIVRRIIVIP